LLAIVVVVAVVVVVVVIVELILFYIFWEQLYSVMTMYLSPHLLPYRVRLTQPTCDSTDFFNKYQSGIYITVILDIVIFDFFPNTVFWKLDIFPSLGIRMERFLLIGPIRKS
jgi:hypothetical protein